jgi:hypothetical protein
MLLERNGKASSRKRTRQINIWYFFITDSINMNKNEVKWCPTKEMVAAFMTKPLQRSHFRRLTLSCPGREKKFGEKIKKMALPQPPSNAADCNFWRNHTSPVRKNWDALSQEQRGVCGCGGSAPALRPRKLGGRSAVAAAAASAAVAAA